MKGTEEFIEVEELIIVKPKKGSRGKRIRQYRQDLNDMDVLDKRFEATRKALNEDESVRRENVRTAFELGIKAALACVIGYVGVKSVQNDENDVILRKKNSQGFFSGFFRSLFKF